MSQVFFDELGIPEPAHRLDLRTSDPAAMTAPISEVVESERPDWVLVYGDTNSTLAGTHAAGEEVPVAHVEAGLRSFDLSMPEERNRIEVDRLSALLFCPDERSASQLEREGVPGRRVVVGDVMGDATRLFEPAAKRREPPYDRPYTALTIHRQANTEPDRLRAIVDALKRTRRRFVFPVHPRTRHALDEHGLPLAAHVEAVDPLGYLEMLALVARAEAVVTDSGGLQKEAYWLRVPCVTLRTTTEWVDTVTAGREPTRGAGRARRRARGGAVPGGRAAALRRRACLRTNRRSPVRLTAVPESTLYDVAVIGAGYVGVPLAATFAEAGSRVLVDRRPAGRRRRAERRDEPHRGRHLRAPRAARRTGLDRREHGLRAGQAGARRPDRAADAALTPARARPLLHRARRTEPRAGAAARPGRRARVDDLARHDPRDPAADPRGGLGPEGRRRLPPRDVARARRPGP